MEPRLETPAVSSVPRLNTWRVLELTENQRYDGGYLPIVEFAEAVLRTGFRGWVSVEVFDGKFKEKYGDDLMGFAHKAKLVTGQLLATALASGDKTK